jgi:uncharacterized protein
MKKAFIVKFKNRQGTEYIYDVSSNLFFKYSHKLKDLLFKDENENFSKLEPYYSFKNQYGCFFSYPLRNDNAPLTEEEIKQSLSNINTLILEITQRCNFRCKYCVYSGNYLYFRTHNERTMPFEIAQKSIDYFFNLLTSLKRTQLVRERYISFYGGEPLLEFELIKNCVEYINSSIKNKRVSDSIKISISTNGYLLNPTIIEFVVQNNIRLDISLDGPPSIHDRNRILKNGEGTFEKVFENIKYIKKKYPEYYKKFIIFLITFSKENDLMELNNFFNNQEYFNKENLFFNGVNPYDTVFYKGKRLEKKNKIHIVRFYEIYKNALLNRNLENISPLIFVLFSGKFGKFLRAGYSLINRKPLFSATCIPGKKIFVSSDGNFHLCEKINHRFSIGNYLEGIDYGRVEKLWEDYNKQIIRNRCNKCFALHYCDVCFATVAKDGYFDADKDKICERVRKNLLKDFRDYFSILEESPGAFGYK